MSDGWLQENIEDRLTALWDKLGTFMGQCETVEGEMLRAVNKIVYRYFNDGDLYHRGYGIETAGGAHAYLVDVSPVRTELAPVFEGMERALDFGDERYEEGLNEMTRIVVEYVEGKNGDYQPNAVDMLNCEAKFEDDDDPYENDEYDDEEDWDDED